MRRASPRPALALLLASLLAPLSCAKHDDAAPADAAPIVDADAPARLGSIASTDGSAGVGPLYDPGPRGDVTLGPWTSSAPIANAQDVLAGTRPRFRRCYDQGLQVDPAMRGELTLSAKVAPSGEVDSAKTTRNKGVSDAVVKCVTRSLGLMQFDAPGPGGATLDVTLRLAPRGPEGGSPANAAPPFDASGLLLGPGSTGRDLVGGSGDGVDAPSTGGATRNTLDVVASLRPAFKRCYQQALVIDASAYGSMSMTMTAKVAPDGSVASVTPTENVGTPDFVLSCVSSALSGAHFDPPGPSGRTIAVPLRFVSQ